MRLSKHLGATLRAAPAETEVVSHQLLLRAGYVRQLGSGIFSYLPLGLRAIRKIESVVREEMNGIGGEELLMPVVHPGELWRRSGRWTTVGDELLRAVDRRGHDLALAMTHEEPMTAIAQTDITSYRQLPMLAYHIQTKFRDEPRPRGGLIRTREFTMKDSYSFDATWEGLEKQYEAHRLAYHRIFARLGLPVIDVSSDVGMMGGKVAHEFMYLSPIGEDTLAICPGCSKAANREVAQFRKDPWPTVGGALEKVATPGAQTIAELAAFLGIDARATAKAVFYWADFDSGPGKLVMALVRGDHDANDTQVQRLAGARALRTATPEEIAGAGAVPGYASPIGVDRARMVVVADELVATAEGLVAGANEAGHHLLNTRCGRDYAPDAIGPVAVVYEGAPCPACGQPLALTRGIEVGNIFQLGTRYSAAMAATFTDEAGQQQPLIMGSYGIGISRLLACLAERFRDERGLMLPPQVAPYAVHLVGLGKSAEAKSHAETAYAKLSAAGIEVLFDDRDASPGVKFADADLMGMPVRVTVSERSIQSGGAELRLRATGETRIVPLDALVNELPNLRESA